MLAGEPAAVAGVGEVSAPGYIPEAQYRAIRASWDAAVRGKVTMSDEEAMSACWRNMQAAAKALAELRALYHQLPPGDPEIVGRSDRDPKGELRPLEYRIRCAVGAVAHWKNYVAAYRARLERPAECKPARLAAMPGADRRLPVERDDDEPLPF